MPLNPEIEIVQQARRKLLDGFDANPGVEEGLHKSATDLYAGRCHFIYELLQNAGDAGAEHVEFILTEDSLEFRHNGPRRFSIEDVDSITSYHDSSKKGVDYEAVGKFGMGFKSVFHYTQTPEIHSGDFHFRIERMFYPETNGVRVDEKLNEWTKFLFPFVNDRRKEIFDEISKGLSEIRPQTVLFLKTIAEVKCHFNDGSYLKIIRENKDNLVRIKRITSASTNCSYYLKFSRQTQVPGLDREVGLDIAYGLSPAGSEDTSAISDLKINNFSIVALTGGAFVYFPAEKEKTYLRFHINSAFATPMSREVLCETKDNVYLLGKLAELTASSLDYLRDNGLLTIETLSVFPLESDFPKESGLFAFFSLNNDDDSNRYKVFAEAVANAFKTRPLLPAKSGGYKCAGELMRSIDGMSEFLTDLDISALETAYTPPVWVKEPTTEDPRVEEFLSALSLRKFGNNNLKRFVLKESGVHYPKDEQITRFQSVLRQFDDRRLREYYRRLSKLYLAVKDSLGAVFMTKARDLRSANELYFDSGDTPEGRDNDFLLRAYDDKNEDILRFLRKAGVREYSISSILERSYGQLKSSSAVDEKNLAVHNHLVQLFISSVEQGKDAVVDFPNFMWLCCDNRGALKFADASQIIMDAPYETTGMRFLLKAYPERYLISPYYSEKLVGPQMEALKKIFKAFKFIREIEVNYIGKDEYVYLTDHPRAQELMPPAWAKRTGLPLYRDCDIYQLRELINLIDDNISVRLWNLLVSLHERSAFGNPFKAVYRYNGSHTQESDSLLASRLMDGAWVKTVDGEWKKPSEVSFLSLHPMYEPRTMCDGLRAVKFGEKAKVSERLNSEKQKAVDTFIEEIGATDADEVRAAVQLVREAQKCGIDIKAQITQRRLASEMPQSCAGDVTRRQQRATDDWQQAPGQTLEIRGRTVRTSPSMVAPARERLHREYLDDNHNMRCQMCRLPMPFDKRDGKPYFECVQIFCKMSRETPDSYLALCPNCQAEYDEWIRKHERAACQLNRTIVGFKIPADQGSVCIALPEEGSVSCPKSPLIGKSLYFTQKHFADVQAVLRAEEQSAE